MGPVILPGDSGPSEGQGKGNYKIRADLNLVGHEAILLFKQVQLQRCLSIQSVCVDIAENWQIILSATSRLEKFCSVMRTCGGQHLKLSPAE